MHLETFYYEIPPMTKAMEVITNFSKLLNGTEIRNKELIIMRFESFYEAQKGASASSHL